MLGREQFANYVNYGSVGGGSGAGATVKDQHLQQVYCKCDAKMMRKMQQRNKTKLSNNKWRCEKDEGCWLQDIGGRTEEQGPRTKD